MFWNVVYWGLRFVVSSGVLNKVVNAVSDVQKNQPGLSGSDKFYIVWDRLTDDEEVYDLMIERGTWLLNVIIEMAVAKVRG